MFEATAGSSAAPALQDIIGKLLAATGGGAAADAS